MSAYLTPRGSQDSLKAAAITPVNLIVMALDLMLLNLSEFQKKLKNVNSLCDIFQGF